MGEKQTPRDDISDIDYVRTLGTPHIRKLLRTTTQSRRELDGYVKNLAKVLKEREDDDQS